jgi:hypothetical protein
VPPRRAPLPGKLRPRDFLTALPDRVRPLLPPSERDLQWRQRWSLVQLWYGDNARIHYEVWFHRRIDRIEVGLHFEADAVTNARLLDHFLDNLIVAKAVSERIEAEPWDRGWTRVYEMIPLEPLDDAFLDRIAERLAHLISNLQPLLDEVISEL